MGMNLRARLTGLFFCLGLPAASMAQALPAPVSGSAPAPAAANSVTLDDLLASEAFGAAWFSPDGARVAYSRTRPFSKGRPGGIVNAGLVSERIMVADTNGGKTVEVEAGDSYYAPVPVIQPWSTDGTKLMTFRVAGGAFGFAVWNASTDRIQRLPGLPKSVWAPFAWVKGKLVYPVLGEGDKQDTSNAQALGLVQRNWLSAWEGKSAPVTVSSANPVFESSAPGPGSLLLANPDDGSAVKLATGDYLALTVSPDGSAIAAIRLDQATPDSFHFEGRRSEVQIFQITPAGAALRQSFPLLDADENMTWSPSGDALLFAAKPAGRPKGETRLYVASRKSRALREIGPAGLSFAVPDIDSFGATLPYGWIGGAPAAIAATSSSGQQAPGGRQGYAEREGLRTDLYTFGGTKARSLTAHTKEGVGEFVTAAGGKAALVVSDGTLWRVDPSGAPAALFGAPEQKVLSFSTVRRFGAAPLARAYFESGGTERVALVVQEGKAPRRAVLDLRTRQLAPLPVAGRLLDVTADLGATLGRKTDGWTSSLVLAGAGERTLALANRHLSDKAVIAPRRFTYSVAGKPFKAWVVDPRGGKAAGPAIVSVYGGRVLGDVPPGDAGTTEPPPPSSVLIESGQLLAGEGYAVIYPSLPIRAGADSDVMQALADHAVAAVDALAAEGVVDANRVGIMGHSFGGYSTAAILARRSDRFKAAVAHAGSFDEIASYGARAFLEGASEDGREEPLTIRFAEAGQIRLKQPPWQALDAYVRNSPFFHVEKIDTPLLMLHGDVDRQGVWYTGAERMYSALVRAGKKPTLVRYWGEGHVAASEAAIRDQWSRVKKWFGHYLRGE
jgi:dipeptidyl aminopeptidase/acylaminoacyl peptidase